MNVSYLAAPRRYCSCSRSCMRIDVNKVYKNVVKTTHNIKTRRRVFFREFHTCRKYFCHVTFSRKFSRSQKILITRSLQRKKKKKEKIQNEMYVLELRYSGNLIIRWNFRKRWRVPLRGNITWIRTSRLNFAAFFIIFLVFSLSPRVLLSTKALYPLAFFAILSEILSPSDLTQLGDLYVVVLWI